MKYPPFGLGRAEAKQRSTSSLSPTRPSILATVATILLAIVALGCSAQLRYRVLSTVFDGVPAPDEPPAESQRVPRGAPAQLTAADDPLQALPPETTQAPPPKILPYATYAAIAAALPKDPMGNLDWVAAVEEKLIDPQFGLDPSAKESLVLPLDIKFDPGIPILEVVFPHVVHTYWLRCDNCHPAIFEMRAGANAVSMTKIFQGEYCGECHGKVAFPVATSCARCHAKLAG